MRGVDAGGVGRQLTRLNTGAVGMPAGAGGDVRIPISFLLVGEAAGIRGEEPECGAATEDGRSDTRSASEGTFELWSYMIYLFLGGIPIHNAHPSGPGGPLTMKVPTDPVIGWNSPPIDRHRSRDSNFARYSDGKESFDDGSG